MRTGAGGSSGRQGLLLGGKSEVSRGETHRGIPGHGKAKAWRAANALPARASAQRGQLSSADAAKVGDQGGSGRVRVTENNRRAGLWADQTGPRIPAVSLARAAESARPVGVDLHDPQYSEAAQNLLWITHPVSAPGTAKAAHRSSLLSPNTGPEKPQLQNISSQYPVGFASWLEVASN